MSQRARALGPLPRLRATKGFQRDGVWLITFHADRAEAADRLHQELEATLAVEQGELAEVEPSVSANTGPGLIGYAALSLRDTGFGAV